MPPRGDGRTLFVAVLIGAVLAANALAVDTGAEASFEAPKRLVTLLGIATAAAVAFAFAPKRDFLAGAWRAAGRAGKVLLVLFGIALAGAAAAAVLSPRQSVAADTLRVVLVFALLLPLGASRAVSERGPALLAVFLAGCAVNAAVSILEGRGLVRPFAIEAVSARSAPGAFLGNPGYLALACALGAIGGAGLLAANRGRVARAAAGVATLLCLAGIAGNQNLTAVSAVAAGGVALAGSAFGRRALWGAILAVLTGAAALLALPGFRTRARESVVAVRSGDWDHVLSYRLGAWSAAQEMARERPLLGFGPGTFGAEFVPHRLAAEIRHRRRFVNPQITSSYGEAHSDFLQPVAEAGAGGIAAVASGLLLLLCLGRVASRRRERPEAAIVFAILLAGGVGALTWFPFQRPVTAVPLLLAAGRGWRLAFGERDGGEP